MCYIDMMDRFYASDATLDSNALPGYPISLATEDGNDNMDVDDEIENGSNDRNFVDGYNSYIGPAEGPVNRGFLKLLRYDPWWLNAEELIALLRTLTDDILAMKSKMNETFIQRDVESCELLKNKKAAEYQFRKVRLAFEGPKYPSKSKAKKTNNEETEEGVESGNKDNSNESTNNNDEQLQKAFKPTATKKEFVSIAQSLCKSYHEWLLSIWMIFKNDFFINVGRSRESKRQSNRTV